MRISARIGLAGPLGLCLVLGASACGEETAPASDPAGGGGTGAVGGAGGTGGIGATGGAAVGGVGGGGVGAVGGAGAADGGATGNVIFEDQFEQTDSVPDPTKWTLCPRGGSHWDRYMSESYDQAYVEGGKLILTGELVEGAYLAGGVQTSGKFDFLYGKIEVNARFVTVQGGWPAIWMMPADMSAGWPSCGEIDIMELVNHETEIHETIHSHYRNDLGHYDDPVAQATVAYDVGEFNTYALEWSAEQMAFSVNGTQALVYPNLHLADEATMQQWPFDKPFFIILNFALGGPDTWPGAIADNELPGSMQVDWVRVTQSE